MVCREDRAWDQQFIMTGRQILDRLKPALQPLPDGAERGWSPGFSLSVSHNENCWLGIQIKIGKSRATVHNRIMARRKKTAVVRVPASTSNLGSGFDTLGLAVKLYNQIRVTAVTGKGVDILSTIGEEDRVSARMMMEEAGKAFFERTGRSSFGVEVSLKGNVPVARGLGYSATARLGLVAGLNELSGTVLDRQQLLEMVAGLEGHPDNASPAVFGGFTVSGMVGERVRCLRFRVSPTLKLVALIPRFKINTEKARRLLPESFSRTDTAHSLNRAALITAAFAARDYEALRGLFDDRVHQPYREPLIPQLSRVIRAGEAAGAIGGFLSGSGSAIICLALEGPEAVARAMRQELPDSKVNILVPDNDGLRIGE